MHIWNTVINYFVDLVSLRHLLDVSNFYFRMLLPKGDQPSGQHLHRTAGRLFGHFLNEQIMRNVQILELSMLGFRVDGLLNQYAQWKISDCYLFLKWNWTSNISLKFFILVNESVSYQSHCSMKPFCQKMIGWKWKRAWRGWVTWKWPEVLLLWLWLSSAGFWSKHWLFF